MKNNSKYPTEASEQIRLFKWLRANKVLSFAIPNGAHSNPKHIRGLKFQGLTPGVPDLFVAVRTRKYGGLFIEMKRQGSAPSAVSGEQRYMIGRLKKAGYRVEVCSGCAEAVEVVSDYLGGNHGQRN